MGTGGLDYFRNYLDIKFKNSPDGGSTYYAFTQPNNILVCPEKVGRPKNLNYPNPGDRMSDTAVAYLFPGFTFNQWGGGPPWWLPDGWVRLDVLAQPFGISGVTYQKALMMDRTFRFYTSTVALNHEDGGNVLYGDGHVAWFRYNDGALGTGVYSNYGGATLPSEFLFADRAQASQLQGMRIAGRVTSWYGNMTSAYR
jgi:prepilin-type processing-associated H-X9-DG protein